MYIIVCIKYWCIHNLYELSPVYIEVNEFLVDAVEKDQTDQVTSLLKGRADPNTKDVSGSPVLCCASFKVGIFCFMLA